MFGRWRRKKGVWFGLWQLFKSSPYGAGIEAFGKTAGIGQGGGAAGRQERRKQ